MSVVRFDLSIKLDEVAQLTVIGFSSSIVYKLSNPEPDSLKEVPWLRNNPVRLQAVNLRLTGPEVHVLDLDEFRALVELVAKEQTSEDRNIDIRWEESFRAEAAGEEAVEAVEEGYGRAEDDTKVSEEGLDNVSVSIAKRGQREIFESITWNGDL